MILLKNAEKAALESETGEWLKIQHSKNKDHGIWVPSLHGKQMGKQWKHQKTLFWGPPKSLQMVTAAMKLKDVSSLEGKL